MGRGRNPGPSRRGVDLTGIITFAEKEDLITLISRITEKIARQIGDAFDSPPPTPSDSESSAANAWVTISVPIENLSLENSPRDLQETDETTQVAASGGPSHGTLSLSPSMSSITHNGLEPQLGELKKELFVMFKKWQSTVLQRVRDIRVAADAHPQDYFDDQTYFLRRGRGYRGGRGGGRGNRGRGGVAISSTGKQDRPGRGFRCAFDPETDTSHCRAPSTAAVRRNRSRAGPAIPPESYSALAATPCE